MFCIASLLAAPAVFATPETDLKQLEDLKKYSSKTLTAVIEDVLAASKKVEAWQDTPTSGNAVRRFNADKKLTGYDVIYQQDAKKADWERLGNLAHELTHAVANEMYDKDFINYANDGTNQKDMPAPVIEKESKSDVWRIKNEDARQGKHLNMPVMNVLIKNLEDLKKLVAGCKLATDKQKLITDKITYALPKPHLEYDTCLSQILVWCQFWQTSTSTDFYKKLDTLVADVVARRHGKTAIAVK